jgi:hypothetical protein
MVKGLPHPFDVSNKSDAIFIVALMQQVTMVCLLHGKVRAVTGALPCLRCLPVRTLPASLCCLS